MRQQARAAVLERGLGGLKSEGTRMESRASRGSMELYGESVAGSKPSLGYRSQDESPVACEKDTYDLELYEHDFQPLE